MPRNGDAHEDSQEQDEQNELILDEVIAGAPDEEDDVVFVDDEEMEHLEALAEAQEALIAAIDGQDLEIPENSPDSIAAFTDHRAASYCVDTLPVAPYNLLVSGDRTCTAYVWRLVPDNDEESKDESRVKAERIIELTGHTETVDFCKFDASGKWLVTGGMNNQLRIWDVQNNFALKKVLENIPNEDLNFVEWHHLAPVLITGGKDLVVWLVNALTGKVMANFIGHEEEVFSAKFTIADKGKHIVSISADKSIRVWSPMTQECVTKIKSFGYRSQKMFHERSILCFALHPNRPIMLSGDEEGRVYVS